MKTTAITSILLCFFPLFGAATDTLTVEQCRFLALQNSPLQQKKLYAESVSALQIRNIGSNSLPRIQLGGQATWQSEVFGLPFKSPGSEIPEVPKDQYKLTLDVSERIWDGGSDQYLRQQRKIESEIAAAQADVDMFSLREIVTDLYLKALLLQENETILALSKKDLETRLVQTEAAVTEGSALRTSADQIRIQILKTEQQIGALQADRKTLLEVLARWIGRENLDFTLLSPKYPVPGQSPERLKVDITRPEHLLFTLQERSLQIGKDALSLRAQPRIEAFAQGGLGRPNPFNFFETDFEPFFLLGLRASWTPFDWGNKRREAQVFDLQIQNLKAQRQFFDQKLDANTLKDQLDEAKWLAQLAQDDAIIALQADILRRADAQVKNGVMTMTDYLAQQSLLTQAQLGRKTHELQAIQAREMYLAKKILLGN